MAKIFIGKTNGFCTLPIYIRTAHVFFSLLATTGAASVAQMPSFSFGFYSKSQKNSRDLNEAKICNGKTKGLALLSLNRFISGFSIHFGKEFQKTAARMAAPEEHWRLPSSPIVGEKHVHFPYVNWY